MFDTHKLITEFDRLAGHFLQGEKTTFAATHPQDRKRLGTNPSLADNGTPPKVVGHLVLVGDIISTQNRLRKKEPDARVAAAVDIVNRVLSLRMDGESAAYAIGSSAIPKMLYGTQWALPSYSATKKFRTRIISAIWGRSSKMRCVEIIMAGLHDPTRIDPRHEGVHRRQLDARR